MFCEIFRTQTLNTHETSLTLGMPRDIPCIAQYTIQPREATLWPRDFRRLPYSPEAYPTARRLPLQSSPAYPAYPSFRNRHTHGTQHTQHSRRPQGPDYKTTRLHSQPTESITKAQRRQIQRKAWQRQIQRNSPESQIQPSRGKLQRQNCRQNYKVWVQRPGVTSSVSRYINHSLQVCCCTELLFKENT